MSARFARAWKRKIRADEGRRHRQINRERRLFANKRIVVTLMTAAAGAALLAIWMTR
jgi:hypothetical protein